MIKFERTPLDNYSEDSTTLTLTCDESDRDDLIFKFCSFMSGCGYNMTDIQHFVYGEMKDVEDLEYQITELQGIIDLLESKLDIHEKSEFDE